jgi:hypothetical protein
MNSIPGGASCCNIWIPNCIVAAKLNLIKVTLIYNYVGLHPVLVPPTQVFFEARNRCFVPLKDASDEFLALGLPLKGRRDQK